LRGNGGGVHTRSSDKDVWRAPDLAQRSGLADSPGNAAMMDWFQSALGTALTAAVLLGLCCGTLGAFVVVRRLALTGDMLSHAVLPGIVAGLVWNEERNPVVVLGAALVAGMLGSAAMRAIQRTTRLKQDAALGIVLSVFFAVGIAMISMRQP